MFSNITASINELLNEAGLSAGRAYPREAIARDGGCFIRTAVESVSQSEPGFARFLGLRHDKDGSTHEVYGMRCDISLALDIYASMASENGAEVCEGAVDEVILALSKCEGVRIGSFSCSRAKPDRDMEMFLCPCRAGMTVLLTAEDHEEAAQFSDFILKGEIKK